MSSPASHIRIAVVDDHQLMRQGVLATLQRWERAQVVLEAEHGVDYAERCAEVGHVHLAVVDLQMPVRDGYDTLRWIARHQPRTRGLAFGFPTGPEQVVRALRCGARAVLSKAIRAEELQQALLQVYLHGFYYNQLVSRELHRAVEQAQATDPPDARWAALSARERELVLLYTDPRVPDLSAVALRMGIAYHTAESHRKGAFRKLGVHGKPELVRLVLTEGWR